MTKFWTLAYSVLLIVLVAARAPFADAQSNACRDLFHSETFKQLSDFGAQTSLRPEANPTKDFVRYYLTDDPSPRVREAVAKLNTDWRLEIRRSLDAETGKENEGLTPWIIGATLDVPRAALKSDDALADYLETLIPQANESKRRARIEENTRQIRKLDARTKTLLTNWFTKNDVRVIVKTAQNLGESKARTIIIDESLIRYPRVIGTVVHEIYHATVTAKLTADATPLEIGRAMFFASEQSQLPSTYASLHRADEYEARLKQIAILKFDKMKNDAQLVEAVADIFQKEQTQALKEILANFETALIKETDDPGNRQRRALKVSIGRTSVYVPLVRAIDDPRAYVKAVLERRHTTLTAASR